MKQTAVVVAPGRGTYNKAELGYLARHHGGQAMVGQFDELRRSAGQETLSALDGANRYSLASHTRGDNASALIYASGWADYQAIDPDRFDILGVTGNSMGWYTALACAGALDPMAGFKVANTMGTLMQEHLIGGQVIVPITGEDWREDAGKRRELLALVAGIDGQPGKVLGLSIDLGGMLVLAGNETGLAAFEKSVPVQGRFPMRLANHAGFHAALQAPVAAEGRARLAPDMFTQPAVPLIDGRGGIWAPCASDVGALWDYTLGHQVTAIFDFATAIRTAARELMPDVFIVLGPGDTLGGSVIASLIRAQWRGWRDKGDFQTAQSERPRILSMGMAKQRDSVI